MKKSFKYYWLPVNATCGKYGSALQAAPVKGHINIVRKLFSAGADVNHCEWGMYGPALHGALRNGHKKVVKLLKAAGADIYLGKGNSARH
jgi:ankyrin repeat protein